MDKSINGSRQDSEDDISAQLFLTVIRVKCKLQLLEPLCRLALNCNYIGVRFAYYFISRIKDAITDVSKPQTVFLYVHQNNNWRNQDGVNA